MANENRKKVSYENGCIYSIVDIRDSIPVYVGSTARLPETRMKGHKDSTTYLSKVQSRMVIHQHMAEHGVDNFKMVLLEKWPCKSRAALELREGHWIQQMQPKCNTRATEVQTDQLTCALCKKVGTIDDYYTYPTKAGVSRPHKRCKKCYNFGKYTKKAVGWENVDPDIQKKVIEMLSDRKISLRDIAETHGLSVRNLTRWVKDGKCI